MGQRCSRYDHDSPVGAAAHMTGATAAVVRRHHDDVNGHDVAQRVVGDGLTQGPYRLNGSIRDGHYEGELCIMVGQTAGHREGRGTAIGDRLTAHHTQYLHELGGDPGPSGHEGSPILERCARYSEQMAQ